MLHLALAGAHSPLLSPGRCQELLQELARPPVRLSLSRRLALALALAEAAPRSAWGQAGHQALRALLELLCEQLTSSNSDYPSLRQQVRAPLPPAPCTSTRRRWRHMFSCLGWFPQTLVDQGFQPCLKTDNS